MCGGYVPVLWALFECCHLCPHLFGDGRCQGLFPSNVFVLPVALGHTTDLEYGGNMSILPKYLSPGTTMGTCRKKFDATV